LELVAAPTPSPSTLVPQTNTATPSSRIALITLSAAAVKRVDETTGQRKRFASVILPAWCRKSPKITEVLPLLYLHGLSTQDFVPALEGFLGTGAGLSAATISRLTTQWQDDARAFGRRDLSGVDYVYVWADGVVRHEALHDRVEVRDLHRPAVVADG
jgi:hypothetical protein